jgi:glyoxylase-like metal-dependent hydrolase (beta-lactamase superfamily II)
MKVMSFAVALAAIALGAGAGRAQTLPDFTKIKVQTAKVAPNLYFLTGSPGIDPGHPEAAGCRIAVLAGPDGVLMVDASYAQETPAIVAAIQAITPAPIRFLVNTHAHPDHTGGNANFAKLGALIFASETARTGIEKPLPPFARAIAAPDTDPTRLPVVTYGVGAPIKLRLDGELVDIIAVAPAHTDGDTIVRFEHADVIMVGDFYRNYGYPFVDAAYGGSLDGTIAAIDAVLALAGPATKIAAGHGTVVQRDALVAYRAMIVDVEARVRKLIDAGKSEQDVVAANVTAAYDATTPGGNSPLPVGRGTSSQRFVKAVYAALKARSK